MVHFKDLKGITSGEIISFAANDKVKHLITDSRKSFFAAEGIFFAIKGDRHDGHQYLQSLYDKGLRQFVVEEDINAKTLPGSNILKVPNSLKALQNIAKYHRGQFSLEVVGVTGSNGKTIIKEWLFQLLIPYKKVVKNPHSYNSQLGVPISVWQINSRHELGIFEAGISQPGEMESLEGIIQPTVGIFSNIGSSHDSGFTSRAEKVKHKSLLFKNTTVVIYCRNHEEVHQELAAKGFTWGQHPESDVRIMELITEGDNTIVRLEFKKEFRLTIPFCDRASVENCLHCITYMLFRGYSPEQVQEGISNLQQVRMRLELKRAINNCYVIDDAYNNDLGGMQIALELLANHKQQNTKSAIISDILQSGVKTDKLYESLNNLLISAGVSRMIGIGPAISKYKYLFGEFASFYNSTDDFLIHHPLADFKDEIILVKGARSYAFEKIVNALEEKIHGTQLEINLDALTNNLNFFRSKLQPDTKLMVMVKAFAYGSGSLEIANLLQFHRVDYLGVAYADEGVTLRKNGIYVPVMVMNPSVDSFEKLLQHQLEPEIYNLNILHSLIEFLGGRPMTIHLKLDTGMHRLGFEIADIDALVLLLKENTNLEVKSIFSHLAGADEAIHTDYSQEQAKLFEQLSAQIMQKLNISPMRHLLNSPGIVRFPEFQFDMVRLGIGLYGLEANNQEQHMLQPISKLKTVISQVRKVKKGQTVGYGRKGVANYDMQIATIAIGYADGFSRAFSNGVGEVWLHGQRAPVVGNVCMDMTMIDVTNVDAKEGDEVEIFGEHLTIMEAAEKIGTIPYEILTSVSQRVKRVYFTE